MKLNLISSFIRCIWAFCLEHRIAGDVIGIFITTRLGVRSLSKCCWLKNMLALKLSTFLLMFFIIVVDSSLTSDDNFMVGHARCAFKLIVIREIVNKTLVASTISYITINLKAQRGCPVFKKYHLYIRSKVIMKFLHVCVG